MDYSEYFFCLLLIGLVVVFWFFGAKIFQPTAIADKPIAKTEPKEYQPILLDRIDTKLSVSKLSEIISKIRGLHLKNVFYLNLNHEKFEFADFDSIDLGIAFQFENESWINWLFCLGDQERHVGYYIDDKRIFSHLSGVPFEPINVLHSSDKWNRFKKETVEDLRIDRVNLDGDLVGRKMILDFSSGLSIGIFSTGEPKMMEDGLLEVKLDFEVDWTIVVFDQDVIKNDTA